MRYWPVPSVTTVRTFSMSAGLDASTVTPGSTAPDPSVTRPAMLGFCCAQAMLGIASTNMHKPTLARTLVIRFLQLCKWVKVRRPYRVAIVAGIASSRHCVSRTSNEMRAGRDSCCAWAFLCAGPERGLRDRDHCRGGPFSLGNGLRRSSVRYGGPRRAVFDQVSSPSDARPDR